MNKYNPDGNGSCISPLPITAPVTAPGCGNYGNMTVTYTNGTSNCTVAHSSGIVNGHFSGTGSATITDSPGGVTNMA